MNKKEDLVKILKSEISPALGCTEPIAVAYSVAVARKYVKGSLELIDISVDPYLYKNALNVGIPGTDERGAYIAAALGYLIGDADKKYEVLLDTGPDDVREAKEMIESEKIRIRVKEDADSLFIQTLLVTDIERIKVITLNNHLNIVEIMINGQAVSAEEIACQKESNDEDFKRKIQDYTPDEMKEFADNVSIKKIGFLKEGIRLNKEIAEEGLKIKNGVGEILSSISKSGLISENVMIYAQVLSSSAAEARMSGSKNPVMSSTGSGNQGITLFLTLDAFAEKNNIKEEKLLRALALANLIAIYIKSYLGTLSSMCGVAAAAAPGASAGIAYLMGGSIDDIYGAILNIFGSITGLICDGAKEGCAYKVALASGWAIEAALLSINGARINYQDGILSDDFEKLVKNIAHVNNPGMVNTNKTILEIMTGAGIMN